MIERALRRACHLAAELRALGHEAEVFPQYGDRITVGTGRTSAGSWLQLVGFGLDGEPLRTAGGFRQDPWRDGPRRDAYERAIRIA